MQRALYVGARLMAVMLPVVSPIAFQAQSVPPMQISSASSGMCLQPNSMENGAAMVQEPCSGSPEQIWVWTLLIGGNLMNGLSGLCLDALGPAHNETPVQWWCNQISNENWEAMVAVETPWPKGVLKSFVSGDCLDTGGNSTPGAAMQIDSCNNSASQIWQFQVQIPPPSAPPPIEISSVLDGMCLQPINKSLEPGAAIVQQACTGFPEQIWFWTLTSGVTHLMNGLSGLCLDVRGAAADSTPVQQWTCPGPGQLQISNENWEAAGSSNKETLKSRVSGTSKYCLAVPEGNTTPGSAMWIYTCKNNTASQTWQFQAQNPPPGVLASPPIGVSSALSGTCLQPINKSVEAGAAIVKQTCTGLPEQIWIWMTLPNGVSHLMNGLSGLCLDARGAAQSGTPVQQWPCNQISNENWEAVAAVGTPDKEILKSRVSGTNNYCLQEGSSSLGSTVQIYSCNNSTSQMWKLGGQSTLVPNVFGWQTDTAANWIEGFNLVPLLQLPPRVALPASISSICNPNTAGRVVGQFPAAGTPALRNSAVTLYFCPSS